MNLSNFLLVSVFFVSPHCFATESAGELKPLKSQLITKDMAWDSTRGFGADEAEVKMMSLMMVESSRAAMIPQKPSGNIDFSLFPNSVAARSPALFRISVPRAKTQQLQFRYEMESMDMGISQVEAQKNNSHFEAKISFPMSGIWNVSVFDQETFLGSKKIDVK